MRQDLARRAGYLFVPWLAACYLSSRKPTDETLDSGADAGTDGAQCDHVRTEADGVVVPGTVVEGETVEVSFSHHRPGTDEYCASGRAVPVSLEGDRIEIELGCSCDELGPSRARDRVVLPPLEPGEYVLVMGSAEFRIVVLPAAECEARRLSAEAFSGVDYSSEVPEGEAATFTIWAFGETCCGKTWGVDERREGNEIELSVTERFCEAQCCCGCEAQDRITHDIYGLPPGDYDVRIGDQIYPLTVTADSCELVPSTPVGLELTATEVCALDLLEVIVDHESDGCGCNIEVGLRWEQRGYILDVTSEVQYCPERCYETVCTDRFRSRGTLRFVTPGTYEVRAGAHRSAVEVLDCRG